MMLASSYNSAAAAAAGVVHVNLSPLPLGATSRHAPESSATWLAMRSVQFHQPWCRNIALLRFAPLSLPLSLYHAHTLCILTSCPVVNLVVLWETRWHEAYFMQCMLSDIHRVQRELDSMHWLEYIAHSLQNTVPMSTCTVTRDSWQYPRFTFLYLFGVRNQF